jgi:hypothetical protein
MEKEWEKKQDDGEDRGEIKTIFQRSHADIKAGGKKMCTDHQWRNRGDMELECKLCPTIIICAIDDERLLAK